MSGVKWLTRFHTMLQLALNHLQIVAMNSLPNLVDIFHKSFSV